MVKFALNFCYCAVDQEKAIVQWKRAVSVHLPFLGSEIVKFGTEFLLLCCRPRKCRFPMETVLFQLIYLSALLGPRMIKFGLNFCYCAVGQGSVGFGWRQAVFSPSALLRPKMVQLGTEFLLLCCKPTNRRFSMETGRFWPVCSFGARNGQTRTEFSLLCLSIKKRQFFNGNVPFLAHLPFWGPKRSNLALNFCSCAVDRKGVVFQWKQSVSGSSALLGPKMV